MITWDAKSNLFYFPDFLQFIRTALNFPPSFRHLILLDLLPASLSLPDPRFSEEKLAFQKLLSSLITSTSSSQRFVWVVDSTNEQRGLHCIRYLLPHISPRAFIVNPPTLKAYFSPCVCFVELRLLAHVSFHHFRQQRGQMSKKGVIMIFAKLCFCYNTEDAHSQIRLVKQILSLDSFIL